MARLRRLRAELVMMGHQRCCITAQFRVRNGAEELPNLLELALQLLASGAAAAKQLDGVLLAFGAAGRLAVDPGAVDQQCGRAVQP